MRDNDLRRIESELVATTIRDDFGYDRPQNEIANDLISCLEELAEAVVAPEPGTSGTSGA